MQPGSGDSGIVRKQFVTRGVTMNRSVRSLLGCLLVTVAGSVAHGQDQAPAAEADPRVATALEAAGLAYRLDGGDFRLTYDLDGGRSQLVWVASGTARIDRLEFRDVWSVAARGTGEVPLELARLLLKENARMVLGAWAVNQGRDQYLAVFVAQLDAGADAGTLQEIVEAVALSADRIEQQLSEKDEF